MANINKNECVFFGLIRLLLIKLWTTKYNNFKNKPHLNSYSKVAKQTDSIIIKHSRERDNKCNVL